jgi:hypothetical protein
MPSPEASLPSFAMGLPRYHVGVLGTMIGAQPEEVAGNRAILARSLWKWRHNLPTRLALEQDHNNSELMPRPCTNEANSSDS